MSASEHLTMLEKLLLVLADGQWHVTEELVERVGRESWSSLLRNHACGNQEAWLQDRET